MNKKKKSDSNWNVALRHPKHNLDVKRILEKKPHSSSSSISADLKLFKSILGKVHGREECIKTWKDLSKVSPIAPGTIDSGFVTYVESPSLFYVILNTKLDHGLRNPCWNMCFESLGGKEVLNKLSVMLTMSFKLQDKVLGKMRPLKLFDLVMVKFVKTKDIVLKNAQGHRSSDLENVYQMRRGVIISQKKEEKMDSTKVVFTVFLFDYGFSVSVSDNFIFPLPEPFHLIAPLAIRCGLFGISPCGLEWNAVDTLLFKQYVAQLMEKGALLSVETCSRMSELWNHYETTLVILRLIRRINGNQKNEVNRQESEVLSDFAMFLVKESLGNPWNNFPARPKIMAPAFCQDSVPVASNIIMKIKEAQLLTPYHPRVFNLLSLAVIAKELYKLFCLRRQQLIELVGLTNKLTFMIEKKV